MVKINPDTNRLAGALTAELAEVINAKSEFYGRPENAAVVPEALITLLAVTIGTNYQREGHAELLRLTGDKLAALVEDAYHLRQLSNAIDRAMARFEETIDDDADPAASLSPETQAQIDALLSSLGGGTSKH